MLVLLAIKHLNPLFEGVNAETQRAERFAEAGRRLGLAPAVRFSAVWASLG